MEEQKMQQEKKSQEAIERMKKSYDEMFDKEKKDQ